MSNSSHIPAAGVRELRPGVSQDDANGRPRAGSPESAVHPEETPSAAEPANGNQANGNQIGPRKLVRPKLPARTSREHTVGSRGESPILTHQIAAMAPHADHESSHAEGFYFQKQVQTQTMMVFVLEDGEKVEGYIEWYDRNAIKVRNDSRTLIYKSAIKYLYKAGDIHGSLDSIKKSR